MTIHLRLERDGQSMGVRSMELLTISRDNLPLTASLSYGTSIPVPGIPDIAKKEILDKWGKFVMNNAVFKLTGDPKDYKYNPNQNVLTCVLHYKKCSIPVIPDDRSQLELLTATIASGLLAKLDSNSDISDKYSEIIKSSIEMAEEIRKQVNIHYI